MLAGNRDRKSQLGRNMSERVNQEEIGVKGVIIFQCMLKKENVGGGGSAFIWLRTDITACLD
jgi:hypothetical protein